VYKKEQMDDEALRMFSDENAISGQGEGGGGDAPASVKNRR